MRMATRQESEIGTKYLALRDSLYSTVNLFDHYSSCATRKDVSEYLGGLFLDAALELSKLERGMSTKLEKVAKTAEMLLDASKRLQESADGEDQTNLLNCGYFCVLMDPIWPIPRDENDTKKVSRNYSERLRTYGLEMLDPKRISQKRLDELEKFLLRLSSVETSRSTSIEV